MHRDQVEPETQSHKAECSTKFDTRDTSDDLLINMFVNMIDLDDFISIHLTCKHFYELTNCNKDNNNLKKRYYHWLKRQWFRIKIQKLYARSIFMRTENTNTINWFQNMHVMIKLKSIILVIKENNLYIFKLLTNPIYTNSHFSLDKIINPTDADKTFSALFEAMVLKSNAIVKYLIRIQYPIIDVKCCIDQNNGLQSKYYLYQFLLYTMPLLYACRYGDVKIVRLLVEHPSMTTEGMNIKSQIGGYTPVHNACFKGHDDIVSLLLKDKRIDVNLTHDEGRTPLMDAINKRNEEICLALIEHDKTI